MPKCPNKPTTVATSITAAQVWNRLIPKIPDSSCCCCDLSGIVDESDIVEESDAVAALIERELSVGSSFDSERADDARKELHKRQYASYKAFTFLKNGIKKAEDPNKDAAYTMS